MVYPGPDTVSMTTASAPAKIILFGEHAVVYGQPAIAVPVSDLRATVTVETAVVGHEGLRIIAADLGEVIQVVDQSENLDSPLAGIVRSILQAADQSSPNMTLTIRSNIPVASGLGSGAAVATALARALALAIDYKLDDDKLNRLVYEAERLHHGTPSGIDNTVIVYETPIYFVRGNPIEFLSVVEPFLLLIADTGKAATTRIVVADVRRLYDADPGRVRALLQVIGGIANKARQAIERGRTETLGPLMVENHLLLQQLTVSSPELDRLVDAAMEAGAEGAKLSGAGRGGNMIALVKENSCENVRQALMQAGAARIFATKVS